MVFSGGGEGGAGGLGDKFTMAGAPKILPPIDSGFGGGKSGNLIFCCSRRSMGSILAGACGNSAGAGFCSVVGLTIGGAIGGMGGFSAGGFNDMGGGTEIMVDGDSGLGGNRGISSGLGFGDN